MILATLKMIVRPEKRSDLLEALRGMLEPARVERGCLSYCLYESTEDRNALLLVEEWKTQGDLESHIRMDSMRQLLALMDLLKQPPEWRFDTVSSTEGMTLIEKVLGAPGGVIPHEK